MTTRGRKPKPAHLKLVQGNPGKRPIESSVGFVADPPAEPDWRDWFPVTNGVQAGVNKRCREAARAEWRRVVPLLAAQGLLTGLDRAVLADYCVCVARIDQLEREISRDGFSVVGDRGGQVRNPAAAALNQYRTQLKFYVSETGLSLVSRGRLKGTGGDGHGDNDLWD